MNRVLIFSSVQPTIGTGDFGGQLHFSLYDGFAILGGNIVSNLQFLEKEKTLVLGIELAAY